jgi:alpha-L-fucosidase
MKKHILIAVVCLGFSIHTQAQNKAIKPASTIAIDEGDSKELIIEKAAHVVPTSNQLAALKNEFIAFIHFGPNTFTRMEWGNGMEDPKVFDLKELHTDQWCEAMKAAGMKMVIITAKHHDGFVLWQSRYTSHGIMSSGFQQGKGDILKNLSASCKKYGLKLGIYLSPADLFQIESPTGLYGNLSKITKRSIPRAVPGRPFQNKTKFEFEVDDYNEYFLNQLFELLTEYGPIHEVWFDGAHPKRKGNQQYNYLAWKKLIHTLAPQAVVFGKEDVRWCGNEAGGTRDTEWNIIPYKENPNQMNSFDDLTAKSLGSRDDLYKGKFLHYQEAETNTSIREGWFYRDDTHQKVRSADDVFDIYERSVGGNSTFLLNIPPNRDGKFSPEDVGVLTEAGKRITETYGRNLFDKATGPKEVLDGNDATFRLLNLPQSEIVLSTPTPVTINRFLLQEAIATHSERVEKHAVDAWIDNNWKEIAAATNIGYKRILRFPDVTASKFRVRILSSRLKPAIATIKAHYYRTRPPQLQLVRDVTGRVTIEPLQTDFGWNPNGENASKNLNQGISIVYTTDGSNPTASSPAYTGPFDMHKGEVKAMALLNQEKGPVASATFGIVKKDWKLLDVDSEANKHQGPLAFDSNNRSYWQSTETQAEHFIAIDLGQEHRLMAFTYTPQKQKPEGMMAKGKIQISQDGKNWQDTDEFTFGNLVNDPTPRNHSFKSPVKTRYVRIMATSLEANSKTLAIAELDFFEP